MSKTIFDFIKDRLIEWDCLLDIYSSFYAISIHAGDDLANVNIIISGERLKLIACNKFGLFYTNLFYLCDPNCIDLVVLYSKKVIKAILLNYSGLEYKID